MAILYRVDDDDPDDLDRADGAGRRPRRWVGLVGLLLTGAIVGAFAFAIVTIYEDGGGAPQTADVPLVQANIAETRVRPAQPGGMDVPHRDRVILQRGPTEDADLLATALLQAPAEEPLSDASMPRPSDRRTVGRNDPTIPEILLERRPTGDGADEPLPDQSAPEEPLPDQTRPAEPLRPDGPLAESMPVPLSPVDGAEPWPEIAGLDVVEDSPVDGLEELIAAVQEAEVEQIVSPPIEQPLDDAVTGNFRVQLAALRDEASVMPEWERLVRLYPDLLQNQEPLTSEPEAGRLIRVSAGPLSESDARRLCGAIVERGGDCFVRVVN